MQQSPKNPQNSQQSPQQSQRQNPQPQQSQGQSPTKALVEYAPLILFFVANWLYGIITATVVLVVATIFALGYSWITARKIPLLLAFGCSAVVLFGALTLIFADDIFIKIKPTLVSLILASLLMLGLILRRNPLKSLLGDTMAVALTASAWRNLTLIWIAMFISLALANEWAWRNLSTDGWVSFKVFGLTGISLGFGVIIALYLFKKNTSTQ